MLTPDIHAQRDPPLNCTNVRLPASHVNRRLALVRRQAHRAEPSVGLKTLRDPADHWLEEASPSGEATTIVSSVQDLLDPRELAGIPVVSPRRLAAL